MSIQARLVVAISGLLTVILLATLLVLGASELVHLRREQARGLESLAQSLAQAGAEAASSGDDIPLLDRLQAVKGTPGLLYAGFLTPEGEVHAHTDPSLLGVRLRDAVSERGLRAESPLRQSYRSADGRAVADLAVPAWRGERKIGTARAGFDADALRARLRADLRASLKRFFLVVVFALAAGLVTAVLLARGLTRPIAELWRGARTVGSGRLDVQLAADRPDELGALAGEFNRMAASLRELDELKEGFLHSVSHEMRSPLTAILAYADTLAQDRSAGLSPTAAKGLGIISQESKRLARFVDDILDLAKLEAKKMEFAFQDADLSPIARSVTELFGPAASQAGLALSLSAAGSFRVKGDPEALRRVLVNLVSNAVKYTPEGGKILVSLARGDGNVRVSVSDTGPGIPADQRAQLFTKFSQLVQTRPALRRVQGSGLGLAIAREIVEAHGGSIGVSDAPGGGALFAFALPAG